MPMKATAACGSRPIRRSLWEMRECRAAVAQVLEEIQPATVRQLYYQLVSRAVIDKTEAAYKGLVHNLTVMRRAHEIPFDWLADNTRWMRKPRTYRSLKDMLEREQEFYRRRCGTIRMLTSKFGWKRTHLLACWSTSPTNGTFRSW